MVARKARGRAAPRRDGEKIRARVTPLVRILTALLVLLTFAITSSRLAAEARRSPRFLVDPAQLLAEEPPPWLPDDVVALLRGQLADLPARSIFAENFQATLREDLLRASAWIERVERMERLYPNRVRADLALRRPVATVRVGDQRLLLDADGRYLHAEPAERATEFVVCRMLELQGAEIRETPRIGALTEDVRLLAGARTAAEVLDPSVRLEERANVRLAAIDIAPPPAPLPLTEGTVGLMTNTGVRIRWGRPAADPRHGALELPVADKVHRLVTIARKHPNLHDLEEVRVDSPKPGIRKRGDGRLEWLTLEERGAAPGR